MSGTHKVFDEALPPRQPGEKSLPYWEMLFRETIAIEILSVVLVCMALLWNAPLERLADPLHTANPAKAPWYFTGLQELLHYFTRFYQSVFYLPVVLALVVVPFFNVNIRNEMLWAKNKFQRVTILIVIVVLLTGVLLHAGAWDAVIPVLTIGTLMVLAAQWHGKAAGRFQNWLSTKPMSFWVMTWFLMEAMILTTIGALFRGPGWVWVWPWRTP